MNTRDILPNFIQLNQNIFRPINALAFTIISHRVVSVLLQLNILNRFYTAEQFRIELPRN